MTKEEARISETSVNFYEITWHNIPDDSHLNLNVISLCALDFGNKQKNVHLFQIRQA
jgi:hypothetical protein